MDLQAQDRAHRIGQTRPVLVFRLVSAHTIETKILQKAGNKRKLEALVISQGKFGRVVDDNGKVILGRGKQKEQTVADMARALLDLEGDEVDVASKDDTIIRSVQSHMIWGPPLTRLVIKTWRFCSIGPKKPCRVKWAGRLVSPRAKLELSRGRRVKRLHSR